MVSGSWRERVVRGTNRDAADARRSGGAGLAPGLDPGWIVACGWLMAAAAVGVQTQLHADLHEHHDLPLLVHWLRDGALAVPLAAVAVAVAALIVRSRSGSSERRTAVARSPVRSPGRCLPRRSSPSSASPASSSTGSCSEPRRSLEAGSRTPLKDGGITLATSLALLIPIALVLGPPWRAAPPWHHRRPVARIVARGDGRASRIPHDRWIHARRRRSMSTHDSRASVADGRHLTRKKEHQAMGQLRFGRPRRARRILGSWLAAGVLIGTQLAVPVAQAATTSGATQAVAPAAVAQTSTIKLAVKAARTEPRAPGGLVTEGVAITTYKWIINEDNTGTTVQRNALPGSGCSSQDPGYPDSCGWTSIAGLASSAPVAAQGDQSAFAGRRAVRAEARPLPHLGARGRLQARRHPVHDPDGRARHRRGAPAADAPADRDHQGAGLRGRDRRPTGSSTRARTACPGSPGSSPTTSAR